MSIEVNTNRNTGIRKITIKRPDGSSVGTITIQSSSLKKTKKLQYRSKRISSQILQAKTSGNAKQVLTRAKGETVALRRKMATGDYNMTEVRRAIQHAERMERIAKKRMKHLQEEEYAEKHGALPQTGFGQEEEEQNDPFAGLDAQELAEMSAEEMQELMEELQEELEELQEENEMEILELIQVHRDMEPHEIEQLKKKHRAEEMREIVEADLKYLKAMFDQMEKERQDSVSGNVSLQLSGVEIPVQIDERSAAQVASESMPAAMPVSGNSIDISV